MIAPDSVDLDQIAEWCRAVMAPVTPAALQRPPWRLGWNAACAALEALAERGDLELVSSVPLAYRPAQRPVQAQGEPFRLSAEERCAVLRLLNKHLEGEQAWLDSPPKTRTSAIDGRPVVILEEPLDMRRAEDATTLRAVRDRLRQA